MKIALLTFHYQNNYGAVLQTLATIKYLESIGHKVTLIDLVRSPKSKTARYIYQNILHHNFKLFRKQYFKPYYSTQYYADANLEHLEKQFDAFVVGSDQVWRIKYTKAFGYRYFLDFVKTKKKIAYASSFGVSFWDQDDQTKQEVSTLLNKFNAVAVREDSGVALCKNVLHVDAVKVVDPTLLLPNSFYLELAQKGKHQLSEHFGVHFFLDNYSKNQLAFIDRYAAEKGIEIINNGIPKFKFNGGSIDVFPRKVEKWLYTLSQSQFIITESFHCIVFALIFKKPFVCLLNERRGVARIESLLKVLNLEHLMLHYNEASTEKLQKLLESPIDFKEIEQILEQQITFSKNFLLKYI